VTALQLVAGLAAPVLRNQHILRYTIDQLRPTPVPTPPPPPGRRPWDEGGGD